jgi:hypothetical protein
MSSGEFNTVSVSSALNIGKNNSGYGSSLNVYGSSRLNGYLNVLGGMNVTSIDKTSDSLTLNIPTLFFSTTQFNEDVEFKKSITIGSIKKNLRIEENLSVVKETFLNSSVNIGSSSDNTININGTSYFKAPVFLNSPLFVNDGMQIFGTSILKGPVKLGYPNSENTIELLSPITNNVKFTNNVEVNTLNVNNSIKGPLKVIGETFLNGNVNLGSDINNYINIKGKLNDLTLSGFTKIEGPVSLGRTSSDDITINGTVIGPLIVSGVSRFVGTLITMGEKIVNGTLTVLGNLNITGKLIINGAEITSSHHFIRVNYSPQTIIPISKMHIDISKNIYAIAYGLKYKDIFRVGDKIKVNGKLYKILNCSTYAVTDTNVIVGRWIYLDQPITTVHKTFELFHHYVLDDTYYNIAEFFLDNSVYNSEIDIVYLFLPFAKESKSRPITFINRSFISNTSLSNISIAVRTRETDTINKETDYIDLGKRFTDTESTFQIKFISNGIDTWYII